MIVLFGSIPLGVSALTGPTLHSVRRQATWAQHPVTRGKPALQHIGDELDRQDFDFFFSEEFCSPGAELAKLETAYALKTPLPLVFGNGVYYGLHYVVDALDYTVVKTTRTGAPVRIDASITLLENPLLGGLFSLITSIAQGRAPAVSPNASENPALRK